jgi:ATP-dependent Clp protease protease subunit
MAQSKTPKLIKTKEGVINITETLFQRRKLFLYDAVSPDSVSDLTQCIMLLDSFSHNPIEIYINSPGGSIDDGFALIDLMRNVKSPIHTIAQGTVASIATLIFVAGNKRYSYSNSVLMLHDLFAEAIDYGQKLKDRVDFYNKEWLAIKDHLLKYTKLTDQEIENSRNGELWLFSQDAKQKGLVDDILK